VMRLQRCDQLVHCPSGMSDGVNGFQNSTEN